MPKTVRNLCFNTFKRIQVLGACWNCRSGATSVRPRFYELTMGNAMMTMGGVVADRGQFC
jgi:hypothetical protein